MKDFSKLKDLLDNNHLWPSSYTFKFIIPQNSEQHLRSILKLDVEIMTYEFRPSSKGNYLSLTFSHVFASSDGVIEIYKRVSMVKGIISI